MRHALGVILLLVIGSAQAATVTIDFEGLSGPGPVESQGFIFSGETTDGGTGLLDGSTAFGAPNDITVMEHSAGQQFQLHSLDLGYIALWQLSPQYWTGTIQLSGYYAAGGSVQAEFSLLSTTKINAVLGAEWAELERVEVSVLGDDCFDYCPRDIVVTPIDNLVVTAVPIPAAVWLFGSALAGLGWMRRKQTV